MIKKLAIVFLALFHLAANAEIYSSVVGDVTDGLIGHWKLDEMSYDGTAGEVVDSSGNGNHGFTLGLPKTNPGVNGRSLVIDSRWGISKNPMAVIPHTDSLTLSGDFTVCLWVYPLHNGSTLIAKRTNAAGSEFDIGLSASSGYISVYSAGAARQFVTPSLLNKWSYLTVCRSNTYFSASVNGVNYGTTDSVFTPLGCQAEIGIGAVRFIPSGRYAATSGNYDDVRLYNRALTGDEIKKLYAVTQKQRESYASVSRDIPYENLPANGLVAHWKLDEMSYDGTAGEVKDSSGNGNDGTSFSKAITNPSKLGRGAFFDGVTSGIRIDDSSFISEAGPYTLSVWIYPLLCSYGERILAKRGTTCRFDLLIGYNDSTIEFYDGLYSTGIPTGSSMLNRWMNIVVVADGISTIGWYIDGGLIKSYNNRNIVGSDADIGIGCFGSGSSKFNGYIDDVRIYNRALTPNEVKILYQAEPRKESVVAVYSGNKLISNPEKKDYPNTVSENVEPVGPVTLTFEYVSTYPATITIGGTGYGQPADPSKAMVDAGDGVFVPWTSNTITVKGKRLRFRGDWRNSGGNFRHLFNNVFTGGHNVTMSGGFDFEGAPVYYMFFATFDGCSNLTGSIPPGLFGNISGAPAASMFQSTFDGCSNLTGESALMPDGTTHLYEQFPTASGTDCDNCYYNATGLNDYATMPAAWK